MPTSSTGCYGRYACSDGWIAVICVAERHWDRILKVVGREDLIGNPDYQENENRLAREDEINEMIESWCRKLTRNEAFEMMRENTIPVAPIRDIDAVRDDRHMHERGMLHNVEHPYMGPIVLPKSPIRLSEFEVSELRIFPEPGADGAAILGDWLGMDSGRIAGLSERGVI